MSSPKRSPSASEPSDSSGPSEAALTAAVKAVLQGPPDPSEVPIHPSSTSHSTASSFTNWLSHPFSVTWRAALVKAPRLVPMSILKYTVPEGPWPFKYDLKSPRGKHSIPLYIWLPERELSTKAHSTDRAGSSTQSSTAPPSLASGLPVIIDFHGGGFVLGSCLEQGPSCAWMCRELGAVVISVDYRMGPIDKFPAAIWDGEDVLQAVFDEDSQTGKELRVEIAKRLEESWKHARLRTKEHKTAAERAIKKEAKKALAAESQTLTQPQKPHDESPQVETPSTSSSASSSTVSLPEVATANIIDITRVALSGFSSGGNLALNLLLSISSPPLTTPWPSRVPPDHAHYIPLLLFYPSLDARLLPSQRARPANLPASSPFWSGVNDILMPSYLPRSQSSHPRASPGLVSVRDSLHPRASVLLVLPELDNLADQSEAWVKKVVAEGRAESLEVLRVPGMTHGWTQFPVSWLGEEERRTREEVFQRSFEAVKDAWGA